MVRHRILLAVLALAICTGIAQANKLSPVLTASTLACNTTTGGTGSEIITVKGATSGGPTYPVVVTAAAPTGFTVTQTTPALPAAAVLASSSSSVVFTVTPTNLCNGTFTYAPVSGVQTATLTSNVTFSYQSWNGTAVTGSPTSDATTAVSITETTPATSPLSASASPVIVSCKLVAGVYTPLPTTFNLTTAAVAGSTATFVTPNTTLSSGSSSYTINNGSSTAVTLTPSSGECSTGSPKLGSTMTTFAYYTTAAPALSSVVLTVPVTVVIVGPPQLSVTSPGAGMGDASGTDALQLTYVKNSENMATGSIALTASSALLFTVDPTTMPAWLTVSPTSQSLLSSGTTSLTFTTTKVADALTPGVQPTAAISLKVAGYASTILYVTLTVQNQAPVLTVQGGNTLNVPWILNTPLPTPTITLLSNGATIPFTTSIPGTNAAGVTVSPAEGAVYSFGTQITVTFNPANFSNVAPGTTLTSTLEVTWSNGTTQNTLIPINLVVNPAASSAATATGITPSSLSPGVAGEVFTVTIYGSGFVAGSSPTFVGVVTSGTTIVNDPNIIANVFNSSSIILTITQPASDSVVNWTKANNQIYLGVCNPATGVATCSTATSTIALTVDSGPVIAANGVTSASTFNPVNTNAGTTPTTPGTGVAPYDMISIFGNNFCISNGTGCLNNQVLYPTVSTGTVSAPAQFATSITPDTTLAPASQRLLQVFFCPTANITTAATLQSTCSVAPLLFATNNQINAMVPSGLTAATDYDIVVRFGLTAATLSGVVLPPYTVITQNYDPGVFTVDSSSDGAIVLATGPYAGYVTNLNNTTNAARVRPSPGVSDIVEIYMSGLGVPPGVYATPAVATTSGTPANCLTPAAYKGAWTPALTSLDGVVLQLPGPTFASGVGVPCWNPAAGSLDSSVAPFSAAFGATAAGGYAPVAGTVDYVGWASGSIAGLYQANVTLPPLLSSPNSSIIAVDASHFVTKAAAAIRQVPVTLTMYPGSTVVTPTNFPTVYMYVQPAMAFTDANGAQATSTIPFSLGTPATPAGGALSTGSLPWQFDTLTVTGAVGVVTMEVTADSVEGACAGSCTAFTLSTGAVTFASTGGPSLANGQTYWVTITATDAGSSGRSMPVETITLYITVTD
jgi:hypothetical protein